MDQTSERSEEENFFIEACNLALFNPHWNACMIWLVVMNKVDEQILFALHMIFRKIGFELAQNVYTCGER